MKSRWCLKCGRFVYQMMATFYKQNICFRKRLIFQEYVYCSTIVFLLSSTRTIVEIRCGSHIPFYLENILSNDKCTTVIYKCTYKNKTVPTSIYKWKEEPSPRGLNSICIQDVFIYCFKTTTNSSLQWLQYRTFYRILNVCYYLKKMKMKIDDCCRFCGIELKSILHVFYVWKKYYLCGEILAYII